jgi:hypothetical protein
VSEQRRGRERAARERDPRSARRRSQRAALVATFAAMVRERFPGLPPGEERRVALSACARGTARVGAMSAERGYLDAAIDLAVVAHARHRFTAYEVLLARGLERDAARAQVRAEVSAVLDAWASPRAGSDGG